MSHYVDFELAGDLCYEVECVGFSAATWPGADDPGDPGEVELDPLVTVVLPAGTRVKITLDEFLDEYRSGRIVVKEPVPGSRIGLPMDRAEARREVEDVVYRDVLHQIGDEFDERLL